MATHTHGKMRMLRPVALAANTEHFVRIGDKIGFLQRQDIVFFPVPKDNVFFPFWFALPHKVRDNSLLSFVCEWCIALRLFRLPYREHTLANPDRSVQKKKKRLCFSVGMTSEPPKAAAQRWTRVYPDCTTTMQCYAHLGQPYSHSLWRPTQPERPHWHIRPS